MIFQILQTIKNKHVCFTPELLVGVSLDGSLLKVLQWMSGMPFSHVPICYVSITDFRSSVQISFNVFSVAFKEN